MKTLKTIVSSYFSKFKTRDLIMSGILVAVIIAYGWDGNDTATLPATTQVPQQMYAPAPQQPAQPQTYGQPRFGQQPTQIQQNNPERFQQTQPNYQQGGYPTSNTSNMYPGQTMQTQRSTY